MEGGGASFLNSNARDVRAKELYEEEAMASSRI